MNRPRMASRVPPQRFVDRAGPDDAPAPFWRIVQAKATDAPAEVFIYDEISWWGLNAADFAKELAAVDAKEIILRLNSPGGDVFDGIAIGNLLRDHPAAKTVKVDALAASIASVIAMIAGTPTTNQPNNKIIMGANSQMMIHDASGFAMGNAADMREMAGILDMISDNIAQAYADRAGGEPAEWREIMRSERWYTAQEAVDAGLADEVMSARKMKPCAECDGKGCAECTDVDARAALRVAARWDAELFGGRRAAQFANALKLMTCPDCDGEGCDECGGTGQVSAMTCPDCDGKGCDECGGTGQMSAMTCPDCNGAGCDECDNTGQVPAARAQAQAEPMSPPAGAAAPEPAPAGDATDRPLDLSRGPVGKALAELEREFRDDVEPKIFGWDLTHADELAGAIRAATKPPTIDVPAWRDLFSGLAQNMPAHRDGPPAPVDLGPLPARTEPAAPPNTRLADLITGAATLALGRELDPQGAAPGAVPIGTGPTYGQPHESGPDGTGPPTSPHRSAMAELIRGAVTVAANDQPEPEGAPAVPDGAPPIDPNPPFRLDVAALRRAVREAWF